MLEGRWGRRARVAIGVAALAMLCVGSVAADTEGGHTGLVGSHRLRERYVSAARFQGGARCTYDDGGGFDEFLVRPPTVFARNVTSAEDFQVVGWRPRIQRRRSDGVWVGYRNGAVERATATDASGAGFSAQSFDNGTSGFPAGRYRAVVDMYWYSSHATESFGTGTVVGQATHLVDVYQIQTISIGPGGDDFTVHRYECDA